MLTPGMRCHSATSSIRGGGDARQWVRSAARNKDRWSSPKYLPWDHSSSQPATPALNSIWKLHGTSFRGCGCGSTPTVRRHSLPTTRVCSSWNALVCLHFSFMPFRRLECLEDGQSGWERVQFRRAKQRQRKRSSQYCAPGDAHQRCNNRCLLDKASACRDGL